MKRAGDLRRDRQVRHEQEGWFFEDEWTDCGLVFEEAEIGKLSNTDE